MQDSTACVSQLFAPFSARCCKFWASLPIMHINTFTYQFYEVQLPVFFPVNLEIILRNVTSHKKLRCAIAKFELKVWHYVNFVYRVCKVISEKNSTLMDRTLPNKCTKCGAKIVMSYWVITFLVLGHFFKPHPVDYRRGLWHKEQCLVFRTLVLSHSCKFSYTGQCTMECKLVSVIRH